MPAKPVTLASLVLLLAASSSTDATRIPVPKPPIQYSAPDAPPIDESGNARGNEIRLELYEPDMQPLTLILANSDRIIIGVPSGSIPSGDYSSGTAYAIYKILIDNVTSYPANPDAVQAALQIGISPRIVAGAVKDGLEKQILSLEMMQSEIPKHDSRFQGIRQDGEYLINKLQGYKSSLPWGIDRYLQKLSEDANPIIHK